MGSGKLNKDPWNIFLIQREFLFIYGAHLAGAEFDRCGGGECREMDETESLEPGRCGSLLLVLACTTWTAGWFIIGGDLERMGHTLAATAVGVVASRLLLLEKVIFLIEVE